MIFPFENYLKFMCYELSSPAPGMKLNFFLPNCNKQASFTNTFINDLPYVPLTFISDFFLNSKLTIENFFIVFAWFL